MTDYAQIVSALRAVPGVADADVEPDANGGGPGTLRLGLEPGVDEVEVAGLVGHVLRERFGLGVDADGVQLIEDAPAPVASQARGSRRPVIARMQIATAGLEVTATVELSLGGESVTGKSTGTATQLGIHRAVATATMRALEAFAGEQARFELEHVELSPAAPERTVLVSVTMVGPSGTDRLTGSANVREDVRQAVIRAVLDAVNRRVEPLLEQAAAQRV